VSPDARHAAFLGQFDIRVERLSPLLLQAGFTISRANDAVSVLDCLWNNPCELVIVNHPVAGLGLDDLLATLRDRSSPSRRAGLVLVAPDDEYPALRRLVGRGVSRVVRRDQLSQRLLEAVGDLLDCSPRLPVRAVIQVESGRRTAATRTLTRTRDLSMTGMLIQGGLELEIGSEFSFELHLPGQETAVVGWARVVRHTDRSREPVQGIGASFASFEGGGQRSLASYLEREVS
jgi:hypothetical protein